MTTLNAEQKEELRHAALAALAVRAPAALAPRQLVSAVKREVPFLFEEADLVAACEVLKGLGLAESVTDELGSTQYWRATANGVLHTERG